MTNDRRPTDDPTRALDAVPAPDQWDDITARAASPDTTVDPVPFTVASPTRRPYVLAAAAIVAVLAIATGLVLTQRDEGSDNVVAGPPATTQLGVDPGDEGEELPEVSLVPSGDAACAIGFDHRSAPGDSWAVGPGPASPPVAFHHWTQTHLAEDPRHGVWNVGVGDQRAEVHVPSLPIFAFAGDSSEHTELRDGEQVTIFFADDLVVLRTFLGDGEDGPCDYFSVAVTGADETANRDTALTLAQALVVQAWPPQGGSPDATGPGDPDETEAESRVPDTESVPVDLTEPPLGQRTWVLISIEQAEPGGSVTDPVDTELGGGDGSGGPPALVMGDRTSVVLEGCNIVPLRTDTRGTVPWLGLTGQTTYAGCPGEVGDQHGTILKLLSLGVMPQFHETADGAVLVLANEEGTLVFRDATGGN